MKQIYINSAHIDEVVIELTTEKIVIKEEKRSRNIKGSQVILQTVDELLQKTDTKLYAIDKILLHSGPGSYTGLRVGAAIANTLAFAMNVPINEKKVGEFVYPIYE